jgi:hypothetical protein
MEEFYPIVFNERGEALDLCGRCILELDQDKWGEKW